MKKVISISLILSIAAPFWLTYSVLQFQKYRVKKEVKKEIAAGLDKHDLVLLKFSIEEIHNLLEWEHSREFKYSGTMYDIIESEVKNDSAFYWCWEDHEETELNKKLKSLVAKEVEKKQKDNSTLKVVNNFFSTLYHSWKNPFDINIISIDRFNAAYYKDNYESIILKPHSPPPDKA